MILVIGGYAAGKRQYVRETLGYADDQMSNQITDDAPVFYGLETQPNTALEQLLHKEVVICDEIGCGLVPMEKDERQRRERVGRLCTALAKEATQVIRVVCGIGQTIKG